MQVGLGATLVVLAGYLVLLAVQGPGHTPLRDVALYTIVQWATASLVLARGLAVRRERAVWLLLGIAMAFTASGDLVWTTSFASVDSAPFPTVADLLYLAFYPASYAALVVLIRHRVDGLPRSLMADGLLAVVALGAAVAALADIPSFAALDDVPTIVGLAYPLLDLLLVAMVAVAMTLVGWRSEVRLWFLAGALVTIGAADLVFSVQQSITGYVEGTWLDALWPVAGVLLVVGAWRSVARPRAASVPSWLLLFTPVGSLILAVAVLVVASRTHLSDLAIALAVATLAGVVVRLVMTMVEAHGLARASERIASTDLLTGLPNRRSFALEAERRLAEAVETGEPVALLLADLDGFKEVNDSLGHAAGDVLLADVAQRLARCLRRPDDLLSRFGGDEFAVLLTNADHAEARRACRDMEAVLAEPFVLDGIAVVPLASIGVAVAPEHGTRLPLLLRRVDIAMHRAKAEHSGHASYDATLGDPDGEDRLQRVNALRDAIATGELVLHYQPKVDLASGDVPGVEALVRWDRPGTGLVMPDDFLPLVEDAGLMPSLTAAVLAQAIEQSAAWSAQGVTLTIAVNLPPSAVLDRGLPTRITALLRRHGVPAHHLVLEITEDSLLIERGRASTILERLRASGIRVSIDDYGQGYSSLSYLRELPVDELKLDRAFVEPMADDPRAAAIVRSTVDLAHSLGLQIVAEGVEDERAAAALVAYGCDSAQGYFYSRPVPPADLVAWLADRELDMQSAGLVPTQR